MVELPSYIIKKSLLVNQKINMFGYHQFTLLVEEDGGSFVFVEARKENEVSINPFTPKSNLIDFTLSNARHFTHHSETP